MSFAIRRLGEPDAADYKAIRLEALKAYPEAFGGSYADESKRDIKEFVASLDRSTIFGAFNGQTLSGVIGWYQSQSPKQAHRANLFGIYVRPDSRGTGCAEKLVEAVVADAGQTSLQIHLTVAANNPAAQKLYERTGFEIYGTDPCSLCVDGNYIDEHLMIKFLD